jgi:hypothetical protein
MAEPALATAERIGPPHHRVGTGDKGGAENAGEEGSRLDIRFHEPDANEDRTVRQ